MKKIVSVIIVFLMVVGMLFVPTLARSEVAINEFCSSSMSHAPSAENSITVVKMEQISNSIILELDRSIDNFGLTIDQRDKQKSMSDKIKDIPGIKAADASRNKIVIILDNDHNQRFVILFGKILLVIMEHFGADSIKFDIDK